MSEIYDSKPNHHRIEKRIYSGILNRVLIATLLGVGM